MSKTLTTSLAAILIAGAAHTQMAEIDVNGDGMLSYPEVQAVLPETTEDDFTLMDGNGDGLLDAEEIARATEAGMFPPMDE